MSDNTVILLVLSISIGFIMCFAIMAYIFKIALKHIKDLEYQNKSQSLADYQYFKKVEADSSTSLLDRYSQLAKKKEDANPIYEEDQYIDLNQAILSGQIPDDITL